MKVTEIAIYSGDVDRPYKIIGEISAKVQAATLFSKTPTIEDIHFKLQEQASRMGANAVIRVEYSRGMSLTSYKVLNAKGVAVVLESDEMKCPICAELIKREAKKCKHCGSDLQQASAALAPLPMQANPNGYCIACGKGLEPQAKFCIGCGATIAAPPPETH
jgi:Double zinc ribbon